MHCNIDARGKAARLITGVVLLAVGVTTLALCRDSAPGLVIGITTNVVGLFAVIEGWSGWCIVRAMGFKTRI